MNLCIMNYIINSGKKEKKSQKYLNPYSNILSCNQSLFSFVEIEIELHFVTVT